MNTIIKNRNTCFNFLKFLKIFIMQSVCLTLAAQTAQNSHNSQNSQTALFTQNTQNALTSEYAFRRYTTDDGLPSMSSVCILQDKKGFIWTAGAAGLTRFDGFEFKTFLKGTFANIYRLDKDKNGNVRAFTRNLMYTVDEREDTLICTAIAGKNYSLTMASSQHLPDGFGIYRDLDSDICALYAIGDSVPVKVFEHKQLEQYIDINRTWFDVDKQQLYMPFDDTLRVFKTASGKMDDYPGVDAKAFCRHNNDLIVLAGDGIYRLINGSGKIECITKHSLHIGVANVRIAVVNETFLFSFDNTLYSYRDSRIETVFKANYISDFMLDSDGNIWVSTYQGLYNLFRLDFKTYLMPDNTDCVRNVVYNAAKNSVYAATLSGNLYEISGTGSRNIKYVESKYRVGFFYDYGTFSDNTLYLPGPGDILRLQNGSSSWLNLSFNETPEYVITLPDGSLLGGEPELAYLFDSQGKTLKKFNREKFRQAVYSKPCIDKQGHLWLGGTYGVTVYDIAADSAVKTIFDNQFKFIRHMNSDNDGNVWFASENRLYKSENDTVRLEKTVDNLIKGIYFTRAGNFMIVSICDGIYIFDKDRTNSSFYNHESGYAGKDPTSGAIVEDADGNIYLPSLSGLFCFNPEKLLRNRSKPRLQLTSVASSSNNIDWKRQNNTGEPDFIAGGTGVGNCLQTDYRHNNLRFEYIGLTYSLAHNVRYRYRLLGFQDEWCNQVACREVTFNNLPHGKYVFELRAEIGDIQTEILSYQFAVLPAFWQTWWFYAVCLLMLIAAVGTLIYLYIQKRNLQRIAAIERQRQLNSLKIQSVRLRSIPHFNANVLAGIEYYIMNFSKEEANKYLAIYSSFTNITLRDVDHTARSLAQEIKYVELYLNLEKMRFGDRFEFRIEADEKVDTDIMFPNMILHTHCENAIKHGLRAKRHGTGKLIVRAVQVKNKQTEINDDKPSDNVLVIIEDNGIGREGSAQLHTHGTGQGLTILSQQINLYNLMNENKIVQRFIDLRDEENKPIGTRIEIEVPKRFSYN